jgi:hypothetical protein
MGIHALAQIANARYGYSCTGPRYGKPFIKGEEKKKKENLIYSQNRLSNKPLQELQEAELKARHDEQLLFAAKDSSLSSLASKLLQIPRTHRSHWMFLTQGRKGRLN